MSRIALFGALIAAVLLPACTKTAADPDRSGYHVKNEGDEDRRFIYGVPQNDR